MYFAAYFCNGCVKPVHFKKGLPLIQNPLDTRGQSVSLKLSKSKTYKRSNNYSSSMQQIKTVL